MIWTEDRVTELRNRYSVDGPTILAAEWGITIGSVMHKARRVGVPASHPFGNRVKSDTAPVNEKYFETWTPGMAYTLGFIFADGNINKAGTHLAFAQHERGKDSLDQIRTDMSVVTEVTPIIRKPDPRCKTNDPVYRLRICNKNIVESLTDLHGIHPGKSSRNDPMPNIPDNMFHHFVRGYFDGDGSISRSIRGVWTAGLVGSHQFITQMRDRICDVAIMEPKSITRRAAYSTTAWTRRRDVMNLAYFLYPWREQYSYMFMRRKQQKFLSALTELSVLEMFKNRSY